MYKFVFANGRVIVTNNKHLPKRLGISVKLVFIRSAITGKFVKLGN